MSQARIVTLLFTDLVGSTELYDRLGDESAEGLRRAHFRLLREALTERGGHEVKSVGDGLMVVFPSAVDAVSCAIAIQEAVARHNRRPQTLGLDVRIGLHAGEPILHEEDYFGSVVNAAKRLCDYASGGQILATDLVRGLAAGHTGLEFRSLGPVDLRGFNEPFVVSEVAWNEPTGTDFALPAVFESASRTPFVGRLAALDELRETWKRASSGERRGVLISGEPGMGKTRLAREIARIAHDEGAIVLYGRSDHEGVIPYQSFVEALRVYVSSCPTDDLRDQVGENGPDLARLVPELRDRLPGISDRQLGDPEAERYRLFRSVGKLLTEAARIAPVLLVMDDLHWADQPTLALLKHVLRDSDPAAILVCGTYRDVEIGRTHPLAEVLSNLRRDRLIERVALDGLSDEEVVSFLEVSAEHSLDEDGVAFARELRVGTNGNPLFIEEILIHLVDTGVLYRSGDRWTADTRIEIPDGLREAVERRLARLSEACNATLVQASVIGPRFELSVLEHMTGTSEDELVPLLEEALEAQLLVEDNDTRGPGFTFVHAIVRQVLYESEIGVRRRRLHEQAAEALEAVHVSDPPLPALAVHYQEANNPEKAIEYTMRAAQAAADVFAYEDAASHLENAIALLDAGEGDKATRARVRSLLGDLMFITGLDYGKGLVWLEESLRLYEELGDAERAAQARSRLGRALSTFDTWMDIDRALELFRAAESVLVRKPESPALGHTYVGLASAALYALRTDEGLVASARGMEIAQRIGREGLMATATALHGWLTWSSGRLAEGERLIDLAWETAERLDHPTLGFVSTWMQAFVAETILDPRAGEAACDRELSRLRTNASPTQRDILTLHRDMLKAWRGDVSGLATPAMAVGADVEVTIDVREQFLAYHLGDWKRAEELCRYALEHRRTASNWLEIAATSHTLAWTLRAQGKLDEIEAVLAPCLPHTSGKFVGGELMERPELAVVCAETGRIEEAQTLIAGCRLAMDGEEDWRGRGGFVDWAEAVVAAGAGRFEDADNLFASSVASLTRYEAVIELAESLLWWGIVLKRTGENSRALDNFGAAVDVYKRAEAGRAFIDRVEAAAS